METDFYTAATPIDSPVSSPSSSAAEGVEVNTGVPRPDESSVDP